MAKVFILPEHTGKHEGMQKVGNYVFTDGRLEVSDDVATKIEPILVRFHGCSVENVVAEPAKEASKEPSLAAAQTKK